jgi:hypothetical protein
LVRKVEERTASHTKEITFRGTHANCTKNTNLFIGEGVAEPANWVDNGQHLT